MKERPILMSGSMIRAILDGTKTQTRRVMKPQPKPFVAHDDPGPFWWFDIHRKGFPVGRVLEGDLPLLLPVLCPYGAPGDRLWVRETWVNNFGKLLYRADCHPDSFEYGAKGWRPSIFMPRWASRLTLEITGVRVEQLRQTSIENMRAEGFRPDNEASLLWRETLAENFRKLWNEINPKHPWEDNPWVWVIEFKRVAL